MSELDEKIVELRKKYEMSSNGFDFVEIGLKKTYLDGRYTIDQLKKIIAAMQELQSWKEANA